MSQVYLVNQFPSTIPEWMETVVGLLVTSGGYEVSYYSDGTSKYTGGPLPSGTLAHTNAWVELTHTVSSRGVAFWCTNAVSPTAWKMLNAIKGWDGITETITTPGMGVDTLAKSFTLNIYNADTPVVAMAFPADGTSACHAFVDSTDGRFMSFAWGTSWNPHFMFGMFAVVIERSNDSEPFVYRMATGTNCARAESTGSSDMFYTPTLCFTGWCGRKVVGGNYRTITTQFYITQNQDMFAGTWFGADVNGAYHPPSVHLARPYNYGGSGVINDTETKGYIPNVGINPNVNVIGTGQPLVALGTANKIGVCFSEFIMPWTGDTTAPLATP